jgi:hypothetical protein
MLSFFNFFIIQGARIKEMSSAVITARAALKVMYLNTLKGE